MRKKTTTYCVRGEWEKADVLAGISSRSAYLGKSKLGLMQTAMLHSRHHWQFVPVTVGQKIDQVGNKEFKEKLWERYRALTTISLRNTHNVLPFAPAPSVRPMSFVQLSLVYTSLSQFLRSIKNTFLPWGPLEQGPGLTSFPTLAPQEQLACICKMNHIATAVVDNQVVSPFELICIFASRAGVKLAKNGGGPSPLDIRDPDTWAFDFNSWGHLNKDEFWDNIVAADSALASFGFKVLNLNIAWEAGCSVIHGTIKELLVVLVKAQFLETVADRPADMTFDDTKDKIFLPADIS